MLAFNGSLFRLTVSWRTRMHRGLAFLLALALLLSLMAPLSVHAASSPAAPASDQARHTPLGMLFVPNAGQTDASVRYEAQAFGGSVYFTENEIVLAFPGSEVSTADAKASDDQKPSALRKTGPVARLRFDSAGKPAIRAEDEQPGVVNILLGSEKKKWFTGLHAFGALTYAGLYQGVDLRYEGTESSLKGTYQVAAGADPAKIRWSYQGAKDVTIDPSTGDLHITLNDGQLTEQAPVAWQEINGQRVPVSAQYELSQDKRVGFSLGEYDKTQPLIIDPTLVYSTYLGGSGADRITAVSVDQSTGQIYAAGETSSVPFPGANPGVNPIYPNMFVARLNPDGSSVYRTILGGGNADSATSISAQNGIVAVAGYTYSADFPGVDPASYKGGADIAAVQISPAGTVLFAALMGSDANDYAYGVALQGSSLFLTGSTDGELTYMGCAPTDCSPNGGTDVVAASFNTSAKSIIYARQFGGFFSDIGRAIAVDNNGNAYLTGSTSSSGAAGRAKFPVTAGALQENSAGGQDAFIVKLNAVGQQQYGSFLSGSDADEGRGLAVDLTGNVVYLTGRTFSPNFPFAGAAKGQDAYVMKLDLSTNLPGYTKLLGGNGTEVGSAVVLDASGTAYVSGATSTTLADATNPFTQVGGPGGNNDAFAARISSTGTLTYGARFGGSSDDYATGLGVNTSGPVAKVYVGGYTNSTNFPVTNTAPNGQFTPGGGDDGFLVQLANSLPVVDLNDNDSTNGIDYSVTFTEPGTSTPGSGPVRLSSGSLSVSDIDNTQLAYAKVSFASLPPDNISENLSITLDTANTGITGSYNTTTGILDLTGGPATTLANWSAVLGSVTYNNTASAPTPGARTVRFEINDGLNSSAPLAIATVTVVESNDAPAVTLTGSPTVDEDTLGAIGGISVADPDAGAGVMDLTLTVPVAEGTLTAANGGGSATVTGSGTNTVVLHGTLADITTALTTLQFKGVQDFNGSTTLTATLNDNGNTGTPATPQSDTKSFTITVAAVNDAPVVPTSPITVNATENTPKVLSLTTDLGLSDSKDTTTPPAAAGATAFNPVASIEITVSPDPAKGTISGTSNSPATITYTPNAAFNGTDTFTYKVCDLGTGKGTGCATQTVIVKVAGVNDPPSFTKGADLPVAPALILEDSDTRSFAGWATALSAGPADESSQVLDFIVSNNNNALFTAGGQPKITVNGTVGDLTFTLAPNANGAATVTVQLHDNGGGNATSPAQTFTITVTPVNDAPGFTKGANVTVNEDNGAKTVTGWATGINAGPADEAGQAVSFNVSNDNNALFSVQPAINPTGTLTFTPAANVYGSATVSVQLSDNGGMANNGADTSAVQTFTITVNPANDAPSFTGGADQPVAPEVFQEDSGAHTVTGWATGMSKGPSDESGQALDFIVTNDKNAMFSVQPAIDATTGNLTFTLAANANGSTTVTVRLHDNGGAAYGGSDTSAADTFTITVTPLNDNPVGPASTSQTTTQNTKLDMTVAGLGVSDKTDMDWGGTALIPAASLDLKNDGVNNYAPAHGSVSFNKDTGAISYTPTTGYAGTDSFTYTVCDQGKGDPASLCFDQTVNLTINGINDPPSFTKGTDLPVAPALLLEDSTPQIYPGWATVLSAGPADESGQTLTFNVTNNNMSLFSVQPKITVNGTVGDLSFTLAPDANGIVMVTAQLQDNGGGNAFSEAQTFLITVTPVNDAPSFTKGADVAVLEDSPAKTVTGWATNIKVGPTNETGQTAAFSVTNDNNGLFSAQPGIDPNGTLTFAPAPGKHGSALVKVTLQDNGGTANTGVDTSVEQSFTITVGPINDLSLSVTAATDPILTGFSTNFTLTATNPHDSVATGAKITFTLPNDLFFDAAGSDPACTAVGQAVTCTASTIAANNGTASFDIRVKINPFLTADKTLVFKANLAADQPDPVLSNNQVDVTLKAIYKLHWYENNFTTAPGSEWSATLVSKAPKGQSFLGEFNNQSITLHFDTVPEHGQVQIEFDLYIIRSWDGNQTIKFPTSPDLMPNIQIGQTIGPDLWEFLTDGQVLMHSTFSNWSNLKQSYPAWYSLTENDWLTGSKGYGTLGYVFQGYIPDMDSIYHISRTLDHSSNTLTLTFRDLGLQEWADESWGIDNVTIDLLGTTTEAKKLFLPVMVK